LLGADGIVYVKDNYTNAVEPEFAAYGHCFERVNQRAGVDVVGQGFQQVAAAERAGRIKLAPHRGEQRLVEALEGAPSAIVLLTPLLTVQNANPAMIAICDTEKPPQRGDKFNAILSGLLPGIDANAIIRCLLRGETVELEVRGRWYLGAARQLTDGSCAVAFSDVSALKEREAILALARDAAESANRLKSKFLATMSHELRTPLNAILGFSEMISQAVLGKSEVAYARYADYARSIHSSGQHLVALVSNILDLSKIDSGAHTLLIEPADLRNLIEEAMALVEPLATEGKIRLLPFNPLGDLSLQADCRALTQVIANLLSNAVKFTAPGGEVEFSAESDSECIILCVRDTGVGIAAEDLEAVFEPFHQGDAKVARRYEGTGLGLAICRGLLEIHGGTIRLESELGTGTRAILHLPRHNTVHVQAVCAA
jgi:signal transduction histidine kinase